eukprot:951943-Prymnesium_polylepis.1
MASNKDTFTDKVRLLLLGTTSSKHKSSGAEHSDFAAWSKEEDALMTKFIDKHGKRWKLMAESIRIPGRTKSTVSNAH